MIREPALGPTLAAAGATPENDAWLMRGPVGEPGEPCHQVRRVHTREDLDEWLDILRDCGWWDDVEPARRLYERLGTEGCISLGTVRPRRSLRHRWPI